MLKVVLKGLAGRKLRAALTAFAVVLGVGMVSGTYVLTDTLKAGLGEIFTIVQVDRRRDHGQERDRQRS
jgi:putative ABC transport system permease protein